MLDKSNYCQIHQGEFDNNSIYPTPSGWKHPLSFQRHPQKIRYPRADIFDVAETRVFYLPDTELPLIDLTIFVKAGAVDVEESKTGLTDLLSSSIVRGGTVNYAPAELAQVLDENAIQIGVSVSEEQSSIHLSVLKDHWEQGLDLLKEIITQPRFDSHVLKVAKNRGLVGLKRQGGDAQSVAIREGMIWHFNKHPYGRDPLQGFQTIPGITDADLRRFIQTYFAPSNMTIVSGFIWYSFSESYSSVSIFRMGSLAENESPRRRGTSNLLMISYRLKLRL